MTVPHDEIFHRVISLESLINILINPIGWLIMEVRMMMFDEKFRCFAVDLVIRGYLSRSVLIPLVSNSQPSTPIRHDLPISSQAPQPLPRTRLPRNAQTVPLTSEETEPIYSNQLDAHSYASIDPDRSISSQSNENEQVSYHSISFSHSSPFDLDLHRFVQFRLSYGWCSLPYCWRSIENSSTN